MTPTQDSPRLHSSLRKLHVQHTCFILGCMGTLAQAALMSWAVQPCSSCKATMDASMVALHEEHGCTAQDIKAACARVPMHPRMKQVCWTCSFRSDECNLGESCVGVMCTETQCQKCVNAMTEGRQESSSQATFLIREAHGSQFFPMAIKPFEGARQHSQLR